MQHGYFNYLAVFQYNKSKIIYLDINIRYYCDKVIKTNKCIFKILMQKKTINYYQKLMLR